MTRLILVLCLLACANYSLATDYKVFQIVNGAKQSIGNLDFSLFNPRASRSNVRPTPCKGDNCKNYLQFEAAEDPSSQFLCSYNPNKIKERLGFEISLNREGPTIYSISCIDSPSTVVLKETERALESVYTKLDFEGGPRASAYNAEAEETKEKNAEEPVKEESFFKKYFWYIVIGGFLLMNFMKMPQANEGQAAPTQGANPR